MQHSKKLHNKKVKQLGWRENIWLWGMVMPGMLLLFVFHYLPIPGVVIAFKDYRPTKGIFASKWVGFKNFEWFFTSEDALRTIPNTVLYSIWFLFIGLVSAITLALLLYYMKNQVAVKIYHTIVIVPRFMSIIIISYITYAVLSPSYGVLNKAITFLGGEKINWYAEPAYWPAILSIVQVWMSVGMSSVLYYATFMSVDLSLIESAHLDGANLFQEIRYIMLPQLSKIVCVNLITSIGGLFSGSLDLFMNVPKEQGVLYPTTDIINTYAYRALLNGRMQQSAAVSLFQNVVGLILVLLANSMIRKISPEDSLF